MALRVWSTLGATRTRSSASSRLGMSRERMCTIASASPVTVDGVDHLRHLRQDALQLVWGDGAAAEQFDVGLGGHAVDGRVDLDGEGADDAVGDEAVDAALHRGGREPHPVADVAVAGPRVLTEEVEDAVVDIVHRGSIRGIVAFEHAVTQLKCS